jgi:putative FmdB family regulatory protein
LPTYEYHCDSCEKNFDVVQSFQDDALTSCPTCGSPVRKVFGNVGIVFKGSGFYKTDSRSGGAAKPASTDGAATESSGSDSSGSSDKSGSDGATPAATPSGDGSSKPAPKESTTTKPAPSTPTKTATSSSKDGKP